MKRIFYLSVLCLLFHAAGFAQVGINKDGTTPDSSAMLDIKSTTAGILIPRMTSIQRAAIKSPAKGLLVYDSTTTTFWFHNGVAWTELTAGAGGSGSGWNLNGNSNLNPGSNFIGTTDKEPLVFKVNNMTAGRLDTTSNVSYGVGALAADSANAGVYGNTAVGNMALYKNGTGANTAVDQATRNTAVGNYAMYANSTGLYNTAVGYGSLSANTSGYFNTALGYGTLQTNASGINNTAVGLVALSYNTTGSLNTAVGTRALQNNTTGYNNIAIGGYALYNNIVGNNLIAIGDSALFNQQANRLGRYCNIAIGTHVLYANTTGIENTATGFTALTANTSGTNNAAYGFDALLQNTTGFSNTGFGSRSLYSNVTGTYNTAVGYQAITSQDGLTNATAIGAYAVVAQSNSIVLGSISGQNGAASATNVGIGVTAPLAPLHIHSANTDNWYGAKTLYLDDALGYPTIRFQGSGAYASRFWNITLEPYTATSGDNAGIPVTNLVLSNDLGYPQVRFENGLTQFSGDVDMLDDATVEGTLHLHNSISYSDIRLKKDIQPLRNALSAVLMLNGYTYYWKNNKDTMQQIGVLAQEVQKVFPQLVEADSKGILGVNYQALIPVLLTAIKDQQKEIDELTKRIDRIEAKLP